MFDPTSVSDGAALADVLVQLAPDFFTPSWRGKIISETGGKWKLKVCHVQHVLSFLSSFELVWTPDPSGHARKGLENNFAQKCLECWNAAVGVDEGKNAFQPTSVRVLL